MLLDCRQVLVPVCLLHRHRRTHQVLRAQQLRDHPECFEEFTENLEDTETPVPAHVSQDLDSERPTKVVSKHSFYTHFPKYRNCKVCVRTKMTRAPCRRRTGDAVPRATKFGDLIQADHKVRNEGGESRNNHRYAVVVQDQATQWIQSYPRRNQTSQETERSLRKFLEPSEKPKVIYTDNSLEFGKSCEYLSWIHRTSTPHRSETNGIAERAVRRVKEGTSAVLLLSWADSLECYCYLRNVPDRSAEGKTHYERRFGEPFKGPVIPFGAMVEYHLISSRDQSRLHQLGKKVPPGIFLGYELIAVGYLERRYSGRI